ncbi:gluconate:H+ symporter [Clostridium sp. SHJSY1]|uniref:gluconate:H+ symporter n=1 Tax=Clostridium sp. SHJSY1 TaxID=2942483 RepID=UPI0028759E7C|nr:gluconate:H+ symporter [Clostridium sp. SHJSY1]MDS0527119.1 gluconate:H+ symporter [Clostridium sp. SHJSY1]
MALITVAFGVLILLVLMMGLKIDGFISLILVSLIVGIMLGMPLEKVTASMYSGIGGQLKSLILILAFGAMLGKLLADSGAAQRIATTLINKFGKKRVQWAMLLTSLIVGITMFFEAGFIVLIPIIFTVVAETGIPLMFVGLPAVIGLSTTHSFLPPHPGPAAVAVTYGASMGKTLLLGLLIAIPAAILVGIFYTKSKWVASVKASVPEGLATSKIFKDDEMPSFGASMFTALIPVILMAITTFADLYLDKESVLLKYISFVGDAPVALLITVLIASYTLGVARGRKLEEVMKSLSGSVKAIAMIILVIGAGGAFKQVIVDAGIGKTISEMTQGLNISPLILAWVIAALLRTAVGSATVAITTASGIVLPLLASTGVSPELLVLATSSGSVFASHVNDPGFWMFKEYFNLPVGQAIKIRTVYTILLSIIGLAGVLVLDIFF